MMSQPVITDIIVPNDYHGKRLDVTLAQLFPDYSRSLLSHCLKEGSITVNDTIAKPKEKIIGGERIRVHIDLTRYETQSDVYEAEDIPLHILFEDEQLLILNKPAGLVVHPGAGNANHTLVNALLNHDKQLDHLPRAGIVHRLDKDTTGLLMVGKTLKSHTHLVRQLQAREIKRRYLALVYGHVISGSTIETCYGRHPRNRLKMAVCSQGKEAITEYTLKKQYQYVTLLDVALKTGRTHQIRVHMDYINHPIVGDPLYGGRARVPKGMPEPVRQVLKQFSRQALHAYSLELLHPVSNLPIQVQAPLPADFQHLLHILDENCV